MSDAVNVSVFTPLSESGNPFIEETYQSLREQTICDWEWVVLENNGGRLPDHIRADRRVQVATAPEHLRGVGALKRYAAELCIGRWILELDHDDVIAPNTIARIVDASEHADFLYSDFAEFHTDSARPNAYDSKFGWEAYGVKFRGRHLLAMVAPSDPIAWRRILWAPNHLRAWRADTYHSVGGHDMSLEFADDHDLVLRTYLSGARCVRIPECLYFYRLHAKQNTVTRNALIQELAGGIYHRYVYSLAEKAARDRGLSLIDLCGAHGCPPRYTPVDRDPAEGRPDSIVGNLDNRWPLADSSVGVLRAFDAIEHLRDPIHVMNEAWRVLAPGGVMLVSVPSTEGPGAWCDPTHVSFWNHLSFRYYTDRSYAKYLGGRFRGRFQLAGLERIGSDIPYVKAELIALKDGYSPMGEVLW